MAGRRLPLLFTLAQIALFWLISSPVPAQEYRQIPTNPIAIVVGQELNFPCWYCLAIDSQGGGRFGATSSIFDLHVISNKYDIGFPRAMVARIESQCAECQPVAITAQARGNSPTSTVFGANFEAYSQGRATVSELNIGAAAGGYVLDVVPVRLPDGNPSIVDSVLKVEGQNGDVGAAKIRSYIDARIKPTEALIIVPDRETVFLKTPAGEQIAVADLLRINELVARVTALETALAAR